MVFVGVLFGVSAFVLFIVAFTHVFKGRMGNEVAFGVMALLMSSLASGLIYYGD